MPDNGNRYCLLHVRDDGTKTNPQYFKTLEELSSHLSICYHDEAPPAIEQWVDGAWVPYVEQSGKNSDLPSS